MATTKRKPSRTKGVSAADVLRAASKAADGAPTRSQARRVAAQRAPKLDAPVTTKVAEPTEAQKRDPLQRSRDIASMPEPELRTYARQLGISMRDAEGLSVERLRQNCRIVIGQLIDALT